MYSTSLSYPITPRKLTVSLLGAIWQTAAANSFFFSWVAPVGGGATLARFGLRTSTTGSQLSCAVATAAGATSGVVNMGALYLPTASGVRATQHTYMCILDGTTVQGFVDGVLAGTATHSLAWDATPGEATAELGSESSAKWVDGQFSALYIFYEAKSAQQVAALQAEAEGSGFDPPPPRALLHAHALHAQRCCLHCCPHSLAFEDLGPA